MKKTILLTICLAIALALAACASATLSIDSSDDGVHAVAKNGAEGSGTGQISIEEGYGLCINHIVEKGTFHVKATDAQGVVVFDEDITDNIADLVDVRGDFDIVISAKDAVGTIDIIAYDIEAQAQADATLPEALSGAKDQDASSAAASLANPWTEAETAEAAGDGAGVGSFQVPEDGTVVDNGPINWYGYRYTELLAQADGSVGAAELTIRKGVKRPAQEVSYDTSDVSGDYNDYTCEWEMEADGWLVKCYGNEDGKAMKAIWTSDNFSYSILVRGQGDLYDTFGLGGDDIAAIVGAVQ